MRPISFKSQEFDKRVEDLLKDWRVLGLAIAIVDGDNTIVKSFGIANVHDGRSVDDDTLFDCASTSKSFTAAAMALVLEDCQRNANEKGSDGPDFSTPVSKLLPDDFQLADAYYTANVTVEDILSHRSGLPRHDDSIFGINAKVPDCPRSVTRNLRNLQLTEPLRTKYQYCNMMYTAAAHLISELSGQPFAEFLEERIWKPLGMQNSYLNAPGLNEFERLKSHTATGYHWDKRREAFKPIDFYDQPEGIGAGSIFSTVSDYAKWIRCMLRQSAPLSKQSHDELVKPRTLIEPEDVPKHGFGYQAYALGWVIDTYHGHRMISHDGLVSGFGSSMRYLPEHDWGIILFTNADEGASGCTETIAMSLLDEVISVPQNDRLNWDKVLKDRLKDDDDKKDGSDDETDEDEVDDRVELPLQCYAGIYYNIGYRTLRVESTGESLFVDCKDRTGPFELTITRKSGNAFKCDITDVLEGEVEECKVKFDLSEANKHVLRIGIAFEDDLFIWFDRIADVP